MVLRPVETVCRHLDPRWVLVADPVPYGYEEQPVVLVALLPTCVPQHQKVDWADVPPPYLMPAATTTVVW